MSANDEVGRILASWQDRRGEGEAIAPEVVISQHPELADELRSHFEFLGLLERQGIPGGPPEAGVPVRLGDFRIVREIGRGGMGVVYEAEQVSLGRRVALKILSLTFASAPKARLRFEREARAASSFHHTNLVPIFAMGEHAGHWYYAMELVRGRPLSRVVEQLRRGASGDEGGPFSTVAESTGARRHAAYARVAEAFAGVAEALQRAHDAGVIHRDVKPSNLLLDSNGVLKIVDFGLAWQHEQGQSALTRTGEMIGTPAYMSPEQARGETKRIDRRTDVYSLGATLYEVLTLKPAFRGGNVGALYEAILSEDPVPPVRHVAHVPRDLQTIVLKAMEKDPARRYDTAADMAQDLRRFAAGTGVAARPVGWPTRAWRWARRHRVRVAASAGVTALLVLATVLTLATRRADRERREIEYERLLARGARAVGFFIVPKNSHTAKPVEAARGFYSDAAALVPERPEAHWLLGVLAGATTEARLAHLAVARERGLPARAWHLARAHVLSQAKRWDEVSRERELASKSDSQGATDAFLEATLLQREGKREEALTLLGRAIEEPGPPVIRMLALKRRAELLLEQREIPSAIDDLARAIELEPAAIELRARLSAAWRMQGDDDAAEARFDETLEWARSHDEPGVWADLAQACFGMREQAWMLRAAEEGIDRHPEAPRVLSIRAFALGWSGDTHGCIATARRLIAADPDSHAGYEVLGRGLTDLQEFKEARQVLQRACELDPLCPRSLQALAWAHMRGGDAETAVELYQKAVALAPRFLDAFRQYGDALRALGRPEAALVQFKHVLEIHPTHVDTVISCGQAHAELRDPKEARKWLDRARELDPTRVDAAEYLWRLQADHGWAAERKADLERSAVEHADDRRFLHLRGHALRRLGREREADDCLARAPTCCDMCRDASASNR